MQLVFSDDTWRVARVKCAPPWSVNTWIAVAGMERKAVIIDPAAELSALRESLDALDATPVAIAVTHGHHDHVVHLADACDAFNLDALIAEPDRRLVRQAAMFGLRFAGRVIRTPQRIVAFAGDGFVRLGGDALRVTSAPGHTPGGVVLQTATFAFTGDTLLHEKIGRTDLPGGDAHKLKETIDALLTSWSDSMVLCPGHGEQWTANEARQWWARVAGSPPALTEFEA